jgi:hypothetical protein
MKIHRKNRIKTTDLVSTNVIFISSYTKVNPNKKINMNFTKIYYKDNYIVQCPNIDTISKYFKIHKLKILDVINIYKDKLFIVILNYKTPMNNFNERKFIDLYESKTESTYYDIYRYNSNYFNNTYLNLNLQNNNVSLKLQDLYYYLIGY